MTLDTSERVRFNIYLDGVLSNMYDRDLFSQDFRKQFSKMVSLYRRIAEYDVKLAQEVSIEAMILVHAGGHLGN